MERSIDRIGLCFHFEGPRVPRWFRTIPAIFFAMGALFPFTESASALAISGRVFLPDGQPAAEAQVRIVPMVGREGMAKLLLGGEAEPPTVADTVTGEDGRYTLDVDPGMYRVLVDAHGHAAVQEYTTPLLEDRTLDPLHLTPVTDAELRVELPDARPADGAWVVASFTGQQTRTWSWRRLFSLVDASGRVDLPVPEGSVVRLSIAHPEAIEVTFEGPIRGGKRFRLEAGVPRHVRVVGPEGEPRSAAGVTVGPGFVPVAVTDAEGLAVVRVPQASDLASPGQSVVILTLDGITGEATLSAPPDQDPQQVTELDLEGTRILDGRIVDADTAEPIGGAWVWSGWDYHRAVVSGPEGTFSLSGVSSSATWLKAAAAGYRGDGENAEEGHDRDHEVALQRVLRLSLEVRDLEGLPVPGALVTARPSDRRRAFEAGWRVGRDPLGEVDADGRASLTLPGPAEIVVSAEREGFAPTTRKLVLPVPETDLPVLLEMSAGRVGVGRVVDEDGSGIGGASLTLRPPRGNDPWARSTDLVPVGETTSGEGGAFRVPFLPAGEFELGVRREGYATLRAVAVEIPEEDLVEVDLGEVVLGPEARVHGYVVDAEGRPIEGALVLVAGNERFARRGGDSSEASTDIEGSFDIGERRPGEKVSLDVRKEGWADGRLALVSLPLEDPLEIVLERPSSLAGVVVDARGSAVGGAELSVTIETTFGPGRSTRHGEHATRADEFGRFVIEGTPPGRLVLEAGAEGYQRAHRELELSPGERREGLEIVLELGAAVTGRVVDEEGEPVRGALLTAQQSGAPDSGMPGMFTGTHARSDSEGRFVLEGLSGSVQISVRIQEHVSTSKTVEVGPDGAHVEIVLPSGVRVSGQVLDAEGRPTPGVELHLVEASRKVRLGGRTEADGTFEIPGAVDGSWQLLAQHDELGVASRELVVEGRDLTGVLLELRPGGVLRGRIRGASEEELAGVSMMGFSFDTGTRLVATIDEQGAWKIEGAPPGNWTVVLDIGGQSLAAQLELVAEEGVAEHDFDLAGGVTLRGVVLQDGNPVQGAMVFLPKGGAGFAATDHQGRFALQGVTPGRREIQASHVQQGLHGSLSVDVGDEDVEVTIPVDRTILEGHVVASGSGEGLSGVTVAVESTDTGLGMLAARDVTDPGGRFRLTGPPTGTVRVVARAEGWEPVETEVGVIAGEALEGIVLEMKRSPGLALRIAAPLPSEVTVAQVDAEGRELTRAKRAVEEGGAVRLTSLASGPSTLLVAAPGRATTAVAVHLPSDAPVRVDLLPATTLRIEVPALDESLGTVEIIGVDGRPHRSLSGPWWSSGGHAKRQDGSAVVQDLPPGAWLVRVTNEDGRTWEGQAVTAPGAPSILRLEEP